MDLRVAACTFVFVASTSAAMAQRELPRRFPAEKFSPQPVQPPMSELPARLSPAANPERWPVAQSPWTKFCGTESSPQGKSICLTVKEVRLQSPAQPFLANVALIEAAGEEKKIVRVTLPSDLQRSAGVQIRVDDDAPRSGDYGECRPNGCMWDFSADASFVARLKAGEWLHVVGVLASGEVASYHLPLGEFARANEGLATDPTAFGREQKQRWEQRTRGPSGSSTPKSKHEP